MCLDDLMDPDHGCVVIAGNKPGDKAVYFCDDGFTLKGEKKSECEDGKWSETAPTCESKFQIVNYTLFKVLDLEHCQTSVKRWLTFDFHDTTLYFYKNVLLFSPDQ